MEVAWLQQTETHLMSYDVVKHSVVTLHQCASDHQQTFHKRAANSHERVGTCTCAVFYQGPRNRQWTSSKRCLPDMNGSKCGMVASCRKTIGRMLISERSGRDISSKTRANHSP